MANDAKKEIDSRDLITLLQYKNDVENMVGRRGQVEKLWDTYMKDKLGDVGDKARK